MNKEEIKQIIEALIQERATLEEKLPHLENLTEGEKSALYQSFKKNAALIIKFEKELYNIDFQEWWLFIEEYSKELIKLNKQ